VLRDDIWEVFDQLDRTRHDYEGVSALSTIVASKDGVILAASEPRRFRSQEMVPTALTARFAGGRDLVLAEDEGHAFARRALAYQERPIGWIFAEIDIHGLLAERREVLVALIATNAGLALIFAGLGYVAIRRMVRPIDVLAEHLERGRDGQIEPIPEASIGSGDSEFGRLFRRYNALVESLNQREQLAARLAEEERMASLGRLASGVAHEINNPLGGMLNAIDTIEHHDSDPVVRRRSLEILKRGLVGIRDVVRATLVTYKSSEADRPLRPSDLDDLRFLVRQEVSRRGLVLIWRNELPDEFAVPAGPVRQAVLNLLLNACAASPAGNDVVFEARTTGDGLRVCVCDRGSGLPPEVARILEANGSDMAPPAEGRGLGAWMVNRLVRELGGAVRAIRPPHGGSRIEISIPARRQRGLRHVA
jgi:signal transduction histidine kinase